MCIRDSVWGDSGYVTYIGLSLVLGMITGMAVSPALIRRYDKKLLYLIACIAGAVTSLLPYAFGVEPVVSLVIPVSYTHLDVYKRQVYDGVRHDKPSFPN